MKGYIILIFIVIEINLQDQAQALYAIQAGQDA